MNDSFNYIVVLVSIVTGLGVTRVLTGISDAIQVANRPRVYWVHLLWMINLFFQLMAFWWVLYRWRNTTQWTYFLFLWVNVAPILAYLASGILCPGDLHQTGSPNWRDYYYKNRRGFFLIFGIIWPLDVVDTLLKGKAHFLAQSSLYLPTIAFWAIASFVAAFTKNEKYHATWAILFPTTQIAYTTLALLNLG